MTPIRYFVSLPSALLIFVPLVACEAEMKPEPVSIGSTAVTVGEVDQEEEEFRDTYEVVRGDTLIAIVDRNRIQNDRFTHEVMSLEPLAQKWRSFGWRVMETDGHDLDSLLGTIDNARTRRTRPTVVIAHTIKGKGVTFMENNPAFHGRAPNKEEFEQAMKELA